MHKLKKSDSFSVNPSIYPKQARAAKKTVRGEPTQRYDIEYPTEAMLKNSALTDAEGLQRAYQQGDAYPYGNTLYIAGSHTAKDWYDDFTKIPFWGNTKNTTRYKEAEKALKANPNISRVIGHSLGGSVALELQKNYPHLQSRTYGAPVWDPRGQDTNPERYRNWLDPFSMFDRSAARSVKWNPLDNFSLTHTYQNIGQQFESEGNDKASGWQNSDGSFSLNQ